MKTIIYNILVIISLIIMVGSIMIGCLMSNVLVGMNIALLSVPASIMFVLTHDGSNILESNNKQ